MVRAPLNECPAALDSPVSNLVFLSGVYLSLTTKVNSLPPCNISEDPEENWKTNIVAHDWRVLEK